MTIQFSKPTRGQEEKDAVVRVIDSGWLAAGEETAKFEQEFSDYISPPGEHYYCIFTNSCTSALKMSYNILKEMGYTGICYPENTFVATYSAAAELSLALCPRGGSVIGLNDKGSGSRHKQSSKKVRAEIRPLSSKILEVQDIPSNLGMLRSIVGCDEHTVLPKCVINVDQQDGSVGRITTTNIHGKEMSGKDCATNATLNTTKQYAKVNVHLGSVKDESVCVVEDSAHRIEPSDPLVGLMRCYSFYVTKNMTTGSGGMFVTKRKDIYDVARTYWKDGIDKSTYERQHGLGYNYQIKRLVSGYDGGDLAAAMGRVQLRRLPAFTQRRNEIRDRYNHALGQQWLGNHIYPVFVDEEKQVGELISYLKDRGIQTSYNYPGTGWLGVSLPIYPSLTDTEVDYIIQTIKEWRGEVLPKSTS